jgi:hypothetical protein
MRIEMKEHVTKYTEKKLVLSKKEAEALVELARPYLMGDYKSIDNTLIYMSLNNIGIFQAKIKVDENDNTTDDIGNFLRMLKDLEDGV